MQRKVLFENLQRLEKVYDKLSFTQEQVDLWYECFSDCDDKTFAEAVMLYIKGNEFPPVIAGVMKCYREIDEYRKEMKEFLFRQYTILRSTWEEPFYKDTFNEFVRTVCSYPKGKRKDVAVEMTHEAVSYHHSCEYEGRTAPTLIEYIRGER